MAKFVTLFLLVLLFTACSKPSAAEKDKLVQYYIGKIKSDTLSNTDKVHYVDTLYTHLINAENDSLNRTLLFDVVREYFKLDQNQAYLLSSRQLLKLSSVQADTSHSAKALYYIGDYFECTAQIDSAFHYYSKSEQLYKKINDTLGIGRITLYKAGILYDAGIFTESEIQTANALRYLIKTNNERLLYETYNLMGLNLKELNNHEESLHYFDLALQELEVMEKNNYAPEKLIRSRATVYNNIGNLFQKKGEFKSASNYYNKGLEGNYIKAYCPELYAMLLDNLGYVTMKAAANDNYPFLLKSAAKIRDSLQTKSGIVTSTIHLGEYYLHKNEPEKGIALLLQGYKKAKEIESTYDIKNALKLLSLNDEDNRAYYGKLYISLTDSLQNIERNTRNKFARIAYETDQIEEKNDTLLKKYTSTVLLFSSALLVLSVIFIIYRLKSKNKELHYLKNQQENNEKIYQLILEQQHQNQTARNEERDRIALELHDGIINRVFATRFNLALLQSNQNDQKEKLVHELLKVEAEIRQVSHDLLQNTLFEDDSFQKALLLLVASQQNDFKTQFECAIDKYIDWSLVPSKTKIHIYRISQEALHNVNKYAQASECLLLLLKKENQIVLQITDNGIGFDENKIKSGIGLKNMRQRTAAINGTFTLKTNSSGTKIEVLF